MTESARELRIAAVQMESRNGCLEENLRRATGFAEEAAGLGASLIVFPELMPTGYIFTPEIWDAAEPREGPTTEWLRSTSDRLGAFVCTSFLEAEGEDFFNTAVVTDPSGEVAGTVRKQTPAAVEACFFKGQANEHVIETDIGKIGVGICYENQMSWLAPLMYRHSVDIMLMPHSAPAPTPTPLVRQSVLERYASVLERLPLYYAGLLGIPVAYINKAGPFNSPVPGLSFYDQHSYFPGESTVVDSDGRILARLGREEGIALADVTLDPRRKARSAPPRRHGRWAVEVPLVINIFAIAEAGGRAWYGRSDERRQRAVAISALNSATAARP